MSTAIFTRELSANPCLLAIVTIAGGRARRLR